MSLVTAPHMYKPEFNTTTGQYYDVCPYDSGQRNRPIYKCPCNGYLFDSRQKFFSHIGSNCHKKHIEDYDLNTKEIEDIKTEKNILLAEKMNLELKYNKKTIQLIKASKAIKHLKDENSKMKELIENLNSRIEFICDQNNKEIEKLKGIITNKEKTIENFENIIRELENYEYEYDEEDFHDCSE